MASAASWRQNRSQLFARLRVENVSTERCSMQVITLCVAWTGEQLCRCKELRRRPRGTVQLNLPSCRQAGDTSCSGKGALEGCTKMFCGNVEVRLRLGPVARLVSRTKRSKLDAVGGSRVLWVRKAYSRVTNLANG